MAVSKSNLSEKAPSLSYKIVGDEEHDCARIVWEGHSDLRAEDLLNPPKETKRDVAVEFLEAALVGGPVPARELFERAELEGISDITLRRAKKDLHVKASRQGKNGQIGGGKWWWSLGDHPLDDHSPPNQMSTLKDAGQRGSDPPEMVKVITLPSPGEHPFSSTTLACEICNAVTYYVHLDGRPLCPKHKS